MSFEFPQARHLPSTPTTIRLLSIRPPNPKNGNIPSQNKKVSYQEYDEQTLDGDEDTYQNNHMHTVQMTATTFPVLRLKENW